MTKSKKRISKKTRKMKGGTKRPKCCVCEKKTDISHSLVPRVCLVKYGKRAHRICEECWWNETTGFALENADHGCPGCKKNFPLKKEKELVIDLTED